MRQGFATAAGTQRYQERFFGLCAAENYRFCLGETSGVPLLASSIGIGTYLGETTGEADQDYCHAIRSALTGGINIVDTAINYRHQRSERCIGQVLAALIDAGELARDEVLVCTKAGYLSFDGNVPQDPKSYLVQEYVKTGIVDPKEVSAGTHCMSPRFLKDQIERSRRNLGLSCIDVFYLHNPETQLGEVTPEHFQARLRAAFATLEEQVGQGTIRYYGMATWNGLRVAPDEPGYISLENCMEAARSVSRTHHFRVVQLPFSLGMPEAFVTRHQPVKGEWMSALDAARSLGLTVVGSSTLMQGRLARDLPERLRKRIGLTEDVDNALQFARSAPGIAAALVGMGRMEHVTRNLELMRLQPMDPTAWLGLFQQS